MHSKTTFVEQGTQVARNGEEKQQVDYFRPKAVCLRWPHKSLLTSKRPSDKLFAWNTLPPLESRWYPHHKLESPWHSQSGQSHK